MCQQRLSSRRCRSQLSDVVDDECEAQAQCTCTSEASTHSPPTSSRQRTGQIQDESCPTRQIVRREVGVAGDVGDGAGVDDAFTGANLRERREVVVPTEVTKVSGDMADGMREAAHNTRTSPRSPCSVTPFVASPSF